MKATLTAALAAMLLAVGLLTNASAAMYTDGYSDPAWQGQPNSTYQEWVNGFTTAATNPAGYKIGGIDGVTDPAQRAALVAQYAPNNPNGTANAGSPNGFVTSTYGIYNFAAKVEPTVTVPNYNLGDGYNTKLVWQISIDRIGEWIDMSTVTVTPAGGSPVSLAPGQTYTDKLYDGTDWIYPETVTTTDGAGILTDLGLFEGAAGGYGEGPDFTKGYRFEWELPGNAESYTFSVLARGTSMSFKGTQVDTIAVAVPEPATLAMGALGSLAIVAIRRRTRCAN